MSEIIALDNGALAGHWVSHYEQPGYNYRPEHKHYDVDDKFFVVRDNWAIRKGLMKVDGYRYTDQIEKPGELVYCFPGETRIPFANGVEKAYRRWYSGKLTILATANKTLRATPNHPILTVNGWKPIGSLTKADHVIEIRDQCISAMMSELNYDNAVPMISEIFGAVDDMGNSFRHRGSRHQFHGDGTENNVDIVGSAWPLWFAIDTDIAHSLQQFAFAVPDLERTSISSIDFFAHSRSRSRASNMRSISEIIAAVLPDTLQSNDIGFAPGSSIDAHGKQHFIDCQARDVKALCDGLDAFASIVSVANVVSVDTREWSGHVYNLQTADNLYIAEGIVSHNCRCYYNWIYNLASLPDDMLTVKGKAALAEELV